jgi:transposase
MLYVGLDIHSKFTVICVLNSLGEIVQQARVRDLEHLLAWLKRLGQPFEVAFEASCGYGLYYEALLAIAARVAVAHPGKLNYSKRKNDRADAEMLAKLLRAGMLPVVHVPSATVRAWRETITFRRHLVQKRTRAKNEVRALLRTIGVRAPSRPGLWTQAGMAWLKRFEFAQPMHALRRDILVEEIESLNRHIELTEKKLNQFAKESPEVMQLLSVPGVGMRTAEAMVAFVDDPHRFGRAKSVGSYFGMIPSQDQSGPKNRLGHITKDGSATVRQLLTEAAWQGIRRSPTIRAFYERVMRNDPCRKRIALTATAHYLARVMWSMLRNGTFWRETPSDKGNLTTSA